MKLCIGRIAMRAGGERGCVSRHGGRINAVSFQFILGSGGDPIGCPCRGELVFYLHMVEPVFVEFFADALGDEMGGRATGIGRGYDDLQRCGGNISDNPKLDNVNHRDFRVGDLGQEIKDLAPQ